MERKYFAEAGLCVFNSSIAIVPIEQLKQHMKADAHKYHIYGILAYPKIYFNKENTFIDGQGIHASFFMPSEDTTYNIPFPINISGLDFTKANMVLNYPYDKMAIKIEDEEYLKSHPGISNEIEIIAQQIFTKFSQSLIQTQRYEVLYIGQSYGKNGERTAFERLTSHSTLQKILEDCQGKYSDKHIFIMLMEIEPQLHLSFCGNSDNDESEQHYRNIMSTPQAEEQIINITEAAIINYFKPEYNVNFIENFPDKNHKGYKKYFDLDYNCLTVEINLEFDYQPKIQLYTQNNELNNLTNFIKYNLFNDDNRANMYEIFRDKNN